MKKNFIRNAGKWWSWQSILHLVSIPWMFPGNSWTRSSPYIFFISVDVTVRPRIYNRSSENSRKRIFHVRLIPQFMNVGIYPIGLNFSPKCWPRVQRVLCCRMYNLLSEKIQQICLHGFLLWTISSLYSLYIISRWFNIVGQFKSTLMSNSFPVSCWDI